MVPFEFRGGPNRLRQSYRFGDSCKGNSVPICLFHRGAGAYRHPNRREIRAIRQRNRLLVVNKRIKVPK
jgi:hypothetical protein